MRGRPNNNYKQINRTKSPTTLNSHSNFPSENPQIGRAALHPKIDPHHMGSLDAKVRLGSPERGYEKKKNSGKKEDCKELSQQAREVQNFNVRMEGKEKEAEEGDNTDNTTEQSSSQHLSYVTGEYQLDSYDLFSRRKNVKFQEKIENLQKCQSRSNNTSSRNSSILKNSSRVLDRSVASTEKSISLQNSFTAVKKCKIGMNSSQDNANNFTRKKYLSLVDQLKSSKEKGLGKDKYIDDLFPPVEASIFSTSVHRRGHLTKLKDQIVWMRLSEILPFNAKVFNLERLGSITINRGQKSFAENYFVAGLNAIRGCPELISHMFQSDNVSPNGIYLVKIFQQNAWKYVIVDDLIPCVRRRGKGKHQELYLPLFLSIQIAQGESAQLWPYLLQKAYANYYSSYENLCFGNAIDFLSELTGVAYKQIPLVGKRVTKDVLQANLTSFNDFLSKEGFIGIGWNEEKSQAYPITIMRHNYTGENICLALCDPDKNYHPKRLELQQLPLEVSSVFIYLFREYQNTVTCPVYPPKQLREKAKRKEGKEKGRYLEIPTNDTVSLRTFTLFKKTKCCLNLKQKQNRFYWQCGITEYLWMRCLLVQKEYDGGYRWISGRYCNQKHIVFEQTLDPGEYIIVVMVEWREKHNKELTVLLSSNCDFLKLQRKNYLREERIIELACMDLAQRNGKLNQINKSICAYTYLCEESALIIENINNQRTRGEVTIMRSINGLKSKVDIMPVNQEFEVDAPQQYGALDKNERRRVIGQSVEIDIAKGESFTVVLRMRGGVDRKFFRVFNFG